MLYFIVRVVVNAIALVITVALLPGLTLIPFDPGPLGTLFSFLLAGLLFGVLNAFVRPIVLFITGNLLISQMVLVVILTNTILMALLDLLMPSFWEVNGLLSLAAGGIIMGLAVFFLEALFGLDSPVFDHGFESLPFYYRWIAKIPSGKRNRIIENMRLRYVYDTIWQYGIDIVFDQTPFAGFRQTMQRLIYRGRPVVIDESAPVTVRLMLQQLGPTYVKIGQMVSSRADTLPLEWKEELERLQNNVPPFDFAVAPDIIIKELGAPPEELFAVFEQQPFAAASTAQVHRAVLLTGEEAAVKVQRPDIQILVRTDLNVMEDVVVVLEKRIEWARNNDLQGMLREFSHNVLDELDYENEAYNATRLADAMKDFEYIKVPKIYQHYSTERVLTMEFVHGIKLTDKAGIEAAGIDTLMLANEFVTAILKQVLVDGFFHADPHPGNLLINTETGQIIFIDMGMMGTLTAERRLDMAEVIWTLKQKDAYGLAQTILRLSDSIGPVDVKGFQRDIDRLVSRYLVYADDLVSLSKAMSEILKLLYNHGLRMKADLTLALKTLIQAEEVVRTLAPELSMVDAMYAAGQQLMVQQLKPENLQNIFTQQFNRATHEVIRQLPELSDATLKWITQYKKGKFVVDVDINTEKIGGEVERVRLSIEQLTVGLLIVGLLIASAIAANIPLTDDLSLLPVIAYFIFIGAALFGFYYIWRMLSDVRRNNRK